MARVLALTADLLFGSRIQGDLTVAGDEVELIADEARLRARLAELEATVPAGAGGPVSPDVLVVDLTDERLDGAGVVAALVAEGALGEGAGSPGMGAIKILGFYSHVDVAAREQAEQAGFDLMVPRSRMAREGAELIRRLAA
jgi:CheY-like chemotaxis protein